MSEVFSNWRIFPLTKQAGSLVGNGKVTIAGTVDVSFTIVEGQKGVFASFPSQKSGKKDEKTGRDIYYPFIKLVDEATYASFQEDAIAAWTAKTSGEVVEVSEETAKPKKKTPF